MVVGVVLARMRSKRLPGKNKRLLAGHPLVLWTLEAARQSKLDRLVTSTDDPEILEMAEEFGFAVARPPEMATDEAPDAPAIRHALEAIQPSGYTEDDIVVHLRPTAPFRRPEEIDKVAELLRRFPCDSVISVRPAREHPKKAYVETGAVGGIRPELVPYTGSSALGEPSQGLPRVWHAAGFIDAAKIGPFLREGRVDCGTVLGWPAPEERAVDIDNEVDFQSAEKLAIKRGWTPGHICDGSPRLERKWIHLGR